MDIKQLLEKMEEFAGEKVGQKPGDQWKGLDKAPPVCHSKELNELIFSLLVAPNSSMWPDLAKFYNLGEMLKVFGNF